MIAERMRADGALIGGESISLNASGAVRNDGSIHGSRETTIKLSFCSVAWAFHHGCAPCAAAVGTQ